MNYLKVTSLLLFLFFIAPFVSFAEKVIVIDPGHGGKFSGTCGYTGNQTGYCEKNANLDVALRLREILKSSDIKVHMTRDSDKAFASTSADDLKERMKVANGFVQGNNENSLFLSIHHNAHPTQPLVKGFETYYYDGINEYEEDYPPDPMQLLLVNENKRFANLVHNETLKRIDMLDRKVRNNQAFFVIRNAQMPSVLVELGFMTNRDEEKYIKTPQFQQNAAQGLATAIINYFKIFEVYDQNNKKLATYDKREDALNYAKSQTKFVKVLDKDKQEIIYSSDKFKVFDKISGLMNEFYTEKEAINFAQKQPGTRVVQDKTGYIVWSNYITKKYEVYNGSVLVGQYLDYDHALSIAKSYSKSQITSIGLKEVLWTNISGVPVDRTIAIERLRGTDRYITAIETSKKMYPTGFAEDKEEKTVVLATGEQFADALSAGPLASKSGSAPILLTKPGMLNEASLAEIKRLGANNIVIIGGYSAVSQSAEDLLVAEGLKVTRISGKDRYATNRAILGELGDLNGIFLASGQNFADALASAPIAAKKGWGILLTEKSWISEQAMPYLAGKEVVIVGGTAAVSEKVEHSLIGANSITRLSGTDRYETLARLLWHFAEDLQGETILVSTGQNFPDALVSAPLSVKNNAPLILLGNTRNRNVEAFLMAYTNNARVNNIHVIGGTSAVDDSKVSIISTKIK
ncbi:cell wall-binding repeat-containing protein [Bacillus haimaensis]|uniref:cell wall-binding repeat-containing protein n=1 Tax=Bacillus haimaensis TaxID=3160967 RepID=UPI003AA920E0